jgi:hypothetical protein
MTTRDEAFKALAKEWESGDVVAENAYIEGRNDQRQQDAASIRAILAHADPGEPGLREVADKAMTAWVKHRDALPDEIPDELGHAMRELDEVLADSALARVPRDDGGLREALENAARSLEALSVAGLPEAKIELIADVRGYASNRAGEARAALASSAGEPEVKHG